MNLVVLVTTIDSEDLQEIAARLKDTDRTIRWVCVTLDKKKLLTEDASVNWKTVDQLSADTIRDGCIENETTDQEGLSCLQCATEGLHKIADCIPAVGVTLDVYLWPPKDVEKSDYIMFLGSLRRLKDWHNAKITIFDKDPSSDTEFLQKFLSSAICINTNDFKVCAVDSLMWRGKVSVCDKIENKGVTIPGVSLHSLSNTSPDLQFPIMHKKRSNSQEVGDHSSQLGRMLEVLHEISLSSVQTLMKTPHVYKLCLYQKHPYSQVLMNYIQQNDNTGMLARLAVYPSQKTPPTCADVGLSTEAWKESMMADIQYVQEPEEDLQDNFEFLYFVITSPYKHTSAENFTAHAHLLQHPYHLNGSLVSNIYHQAMVPSNGEESVEFNLDELPLLSGETVREVEDDVITIQRKMLESWKDEVPAEELASFLRNIRLTYLHRLAEKLPKYRQDGHALKVNLEINISEISENTYDWPERLIQQYQESQKRSLSRIRSSESMPMSSPMQPCETSTTVDIQSFLNFFHPCGSAAGNNLSPIRRRQPSRAQSKMLQPDVTNSNLVSWPESKDVVSHDVYYNIDKKSEKVNNHLNRIQEKYVKEETYSSCQSPVVLFPKYVKRKRSLDNSELRRSPRKKASRNAYDENLSATLADEKRQRMRSSRLSDSLSLTPLSTIHERDSRRRFSTPQALPSQTHRRSSSGAAQTTLDNSTHRRRSDFGVNKTSTPVPRQEEHLRGDSHGNSSFITPQDQSLNKESRSDRHKRKLQETVDGVLLENGVARDDPIFKSCSTRLFKVTKLFVMDLPTSRNLKDEMKKIAESQVKQVIEVDRNRLKSSLNARHKKKSV